MFSLSGRSRSSVYNGCTQSTLNLPCHRYSTGNAQELALRAFASQPIGKSEKLFPLAKRVLITKSAENKSFLRKNDNSDQANAITRDDDSNTRKFNDFLAAKLREDLKRSDPSLKRLSFEEYKKEQLLSYENYTKIFIEGLRKNRPELAEKYDNPEALERVYKNYCETDYGAYIKGFEASNPYLML